MNKMNIIKLSIVISSIFFIGSCTISTNSSEMPKEKFERVKTKPERTQTPNRAKTIRPSAKGSRNSSKPIINPDDKVKFYLKQENNTEKHLTKVGFEVKYFIDFLHKKVILNKDQKVRIKELATENIKVKLDLQEQLSTLRANPNSDRKEIRSLVKAVAVKHQEEDKYLKEVLTEVQYKAYKNN